jgi:2-keto-4-pentenoate hydratase/2-oxohepta-3-ene-1,7-dioic acid hydratase in catechol pathway
MRLISYRLKGEAGVGVMVDDKNFVALPKAAPELPRSLKGLIEMEGGFAKAAAAAKGRKPDLAFSDVTLDPLITEPNAIWCLALNYKLHINETGLTTSAKYPQIFLRMPCSQVGHGRPILCPDPKVAMLYEYEGELAVIIGKGGRHIKEGDALAHVAGYTCFVDGSVRDWQKHSVTSGKNFIGTGPLGPWMVTSDEIPDPTKLTLMTRLNGVEMQRSGTDMLIYSVPRIIAYVSGFTPLAPGDVIATGTPAGVGHRRNPPLWMKAGDTLEVEITGIGTLRSRIVDES